MADKAPIDDIVPVTPPVLMEESSFVAPREAMYSMWVSLYGKEEADRRADQCGIPPEERVITPD
jgi:hypothetical protein